MPRSPVSPAARVFLVLALTVGITVAALASPPQQAAKAPATAAKSAPPARRSSVDPSIAAALRQVSAAHIKATIEKLVSFGTRLTIGPADPSAIASGRGVGAAREWIKSEFERYSQACGGCLEVKTLAYTQQPARRVPEATEIIDVYAIQRGTDPEAAKRIVLVTGHYDSRPSDTLDTKADAPGANDDGSGTAVSLECARVLSQHKFPATIVFLTVAGEEQGLLGARHFAQMAKQEGWDLGAVLNNDIVGGDRSPGQNPNVVRVFSEGVLLPAVTKAADVRRIRTRATENDSPSRELARYIAQTGREYLPGPFGPMMVFRPDRYLRGGDHTAFNEEGFAAVRFSEYRENYAHQHNNVRVEKGVQFGDLPKFVDFDYVAHVARLNAAVLASLASAPAPPADVKIDTRKLTDDTTLDWQAARGSQGASYEVVWRATTAPQWEHTQAVGNVTSVTLPISKDNVIFAVRSLDGHGHRSIAVLPVPSGRAAPETEPSN